MSTLDGRAIARDHEQSCGFLVIGSGPAGAAAAKVLAEGGADVLVVEEGHPVDPAGLGRDSFHALRTLYRGLGATLVEGRAPFPYVQGRAVGGTSVVNGAISWRLPRDVWDEWIAADPGLEARLPWEALQDEQALLEARLGIVPTPPGIAGEKNLRFARGAEAIGLEHRPIARNAPGCEGAGQCLEGCAKGRKAGMDRTLLVDAQAAGATVLSGVAIERLETAGDRAVAATGSAAGGGRVRVRAREGVVLAASAIQSPWLLLRSGIDDGPVGRHFQCHPGASVGARFPDEIRLWEGATQGHEGTGLRREGLKFEVLGYDVGLAVGRVPGIGRAHAAALDALDRHLHVGVALRAEAEGRVRAGWFGGGPRVSLELTPRDVGKLRKGIAVLCELLLAAGAEAVFPSISGVPAELTDPAAARRLVDEGPTDARAFSMAATHLFGTCRMATSPERGVVRPDLRHHAIDRLWVVDSSVFPSNTGVNPQTSLLAIATLGARGIVRA